MTTTPANMTDEQRAKTKALQELCDIAPAARDAAWAEKFFAAFPGAVFKSRNPQVLRGPDGFPYFILELPEPGVGFQPFFPAEVIAHCAANGFGIVLNPDEDPPDFVFPYGAMWTYRQRGIFYPPPEATAEGESGATVEKVKEEREVLVAQPSEEFFPTDARRAVATFLKYALGIETPSCFLLVDPARKPDKSLVFNVFPSSFANAEQFYGALRALGWFLPNDYVATAIDKDNELAQHFQPLPLPQA